MSNPTFKPSEGHREEFRKYLEKNGVMEALTKVLVSLYEEVDKPQDALEYLRDKLALQAGVDTPTQMRIKQEELEQKIQELEEEINQLKMPAEQPSEVEAEHRDESENPDNPIGSGPVPALDAPEDSVPPPEEPLPAEVEEQATQ